MVKATSTADVRGVTVDSPAFSGGYSADKADSNGELFKQYDYVAIMGIVPVIDNGTCTVNGRCMPADNGTAIPSDNNMGYHVIERVDDTHIMIAIEPGADMLNRIKSNIVELQNHTSDTNIHVTAAEKSAWNAKLDSYTETDPTVPDWAKQPNKPNYTASEVGAVPTSRTVNGKALSANITLSASDVGAAPAYTYGTEDLVAGTSQLATGTLYFMYE